MSYPHAGIRIDRIPAEEGGGLIFALGMVLVSMIAFPALLVLTPVARWLTTLLVKDP